MSIEDHKYRYEDSDKIPSNVEDLIETIEKDLKILDQFGHPRLDSFAYERLYNSLTRKAYKQRIARFVRSISSVAAGVLVIFSLWLYFTSGYGEYRKELLRSKTRGFGVAEVYLADNSGDSADVKPVDTSDVGSNMDKSIDAIYDELSNLEVLLGKNNSSDAIDELSDVIADIRWEFDND